MKRPTTGPDLCHCLAARRNARHMTRLYDRAFSGSGISVSQFSILALIAEHGPVSIAALAELMVMDRTTLVRALKPLRTEGLLACDTEGPKAALLYQLTETGLNTLNACIPLWQAAQAEYESRVGTPRATRLRNDILDVVFSEP